MLIRNNQNISWNERPYRVAHFCSQTKGSYVNHYNILKYKLILTVTEHVELGLLCACTVNIIHAVSKSSGDTIRACLRS